MKFYQLTILLFIIMSTYAINVPFTDCGSILAPINKIEANMWTPVPSQTLSMTSYGTNKQEITGGTFEIKTYYLGIEIGDDKGNFCDLTQCPIPAGEFELVSTSVFPSDAPNGSYKSHMVTRNQNNEVLYCTELQFSV